MPTAHELFQQHRFEKCEPLLRGVTGTYLFEIENAGYWFISVRDGAITLEEVRHDADCTISCEEPDFIDIIEGRRNLITAAMQGRVKIRGDVTLAQRFHALVRALTEKRREEAA
jgi:putative sterol carrier protein